MIEKGTPTLAAALLAGAALAAFTPIEAAAQRQDQPGQIQQAQGQQDTAAADLTWRNATIAELDEQRRTLTTNEGTTYRLSGSVPLDSVRLRPGQDVQIYYHPEGGELVATQVLPLDTVGTGQAGVSGYVDGNVSSTLIRGSEEHIQSLERRIESLEHQLQALAEQARSPVVPEAASGEREWTTQAYGSTGPHPRRVPDQQASGGGQSGAPGGQAITVFPQPEGPGARTQFGAQGQFGGPGGGAAMGQAVPMDPQYQAYRNDRLANLDRRYSHWRAEKIAEMDRSYANWRADLINQFDQAYLEQRNEELAALDRAYRAQRGTIQGQGSFGGSQ